MMMQCHTDDVIGHIYDVTDPWPDTHIWLRARPKAERVFAEYENFLNLSDPTGPGRFSASYIFWTKLPIGNWFSPSESHIQ